MSLRQLTEWKRGLTVCLVLALALAVTTGAARPDDVAKKPADKAKPEAKADDKAKPADKPKDEEQSKGDEKPAEPKEITVPAPSGGHPATDLINKELAKFWAANTVTPSKKATDYE